MFNAIGSAPTILRARLPNSAAPEPVAEGGIDDVVGCGPDYPICDDFQRATPEGGPLEWTTDIASGVLSIYELEHRSAPSCLKVEALTNADGGSVGGHASLRRNFPPTAKRLRVVFSILTEGNSPTWQIAGFGFANAMFIYLLRRADGLRRLTGDLTFNFGEPRTLFFGIPYATQRTAPTRIYFDDVGVRGD